MNKFGVSRVQCSVVQRFSAVLFKTFSFDRFRLCSTFNSYFLYHNECSVNEFKMGMLAMEQNVSFLFHLSTPSFHCSGARWWEWKKSTGHKWWFCLCYYILFAKSFNYLIGAPKMWLHISESFEFWIYWIAWIWLVPSFDWKKYTQENKSVAFLVYRISVVCVFVCECVCNMHIATGHTIKIC